MNPIHGAKVILTLLSTLALVAMNGVAGADGLQEKLKALFDVQQPTGSGPFPAVVLVSGCSGFHPDIGKDFYDRVSARLVGEGFVTIKVDYVGARGAKNCQSPYIAKGEVADDIMTAVKHLHALPFVDAKTVNLLGWSYGGGSIMTALGGASPVPAAAAIVYYPYCSGTAPWQAKTPMLILSGTKDSVAPFGECEGLVRSVPDPASVKVVHYEGAYHGFDNDALPAEKQYQFGTLGYHAEAAAKAWAEVKGFLRR